MEDFTENKIDMLFAVTEAVSGATKDDILSKKREQYISVARNIVGYILHNELGLTVMESGKIIGRDHSTITYYSKVFDDNYNFFRDFREKYVMISETFWGNYMVADDCDLDLKIKSLKNLIAELEFQKQLLTKNY